MGTRVDPKDPPAKTKSDKSIDFCTTCTLPASMHHARANENASRDVVTVGEN